MSNVSLYLVTLFCSVLFCSGQLRSALVCSVCFVLLCTWLPVLVFFLAFDFLRLCVVIRFFHPRHNGQWPPSSKDFYTRSYPLHYFLILILEKEPFSMLSAKQDNDGYQFYNVFGMTRSWTGDWTRDLPHSMPALYHEAIKEAAPVLVNICWIMCFFVQHQNS